MRRGGINGEIGNRLEFQIERELNDTSRWRTVYVSWRTFRQLSVAAGRYKLPFGRGLTNHVQLSLTGDIDDIGPSFADRLMATPLRSLAETFEMLRVGLEGPTGDGTTGFF